MDTTWEQFGFMIIVLAIAVAGLVWTLLRSARKQVNNPSTKVFTDRGYEPETKALTPKQVRDTDEMRYTK